jgi:hypothetical protein
VPAPTQHGRRGAVKPASPDRTELHNHPTPPQRTRPCSCSPGTFLSRGGKAENILCQPTACLSFTAGKGKALVPARSTPRLSFPPPRRPLFRCAFQSLCGCACSLTHLCTAGIHRAVPCSSPSPGKKNARVVEFFSPPKNRASGSELKEWTLLVENGKLI